MRWRFTLALGGLSLAPAPAPAPAQTPALRSLARAESLSAAGRYSEASASSTSPSQAWNPRTPGPAALQAKAGWMLDTTVANLQMIREARRRSGTTPQLDSIITQLSSRAKELPGGAS